MKTPLMLSVAAAAVLTLNLQADETRERIDAMQAQMEKLQAELDALKEANGLSEDTEEADNGTADDEEEAVSEEDDAEDEEADAEDTDDEEDDTAERLDDIEEQLSELTRNTSGSHLKFGVDFRTSYDYIHYKMAGEDRNGDDTKTNDALFTNRLWINMDWMATEHISFTGQIAYNKAYGARSGMTDRDFEDFDWIVNENPYDGTLRIRSAYFLLRYDELFGANVPWTFSLGRRPSTNGHLINLRDDLAPASPMGHNINVEFDGASAKFSLDESTGIDGMYLKFCAGRGLTNADGKFTSAPFASDNQSNIDLAGLIFVPYDDGTYSVGAQYYFANNLIDVVNPMDPSQGFAEVGSLHAFTANFAVNGIGDEWSDFLDETILFVSGAWSITDPDKNGQGMLGSHDSKTGSSYWIGAQFPSLISEDGRWGVEWNHGDKYWRSITYGEDTMIGSKMATRGNAWEAYFTEYLIEDVFSLQLRYTYIDYDYSGSNGFFGSTTGTPMKISDTMMVPDGHGGMVNIASQVVDVAQDLRIYLRYRY